MGRVVTKKGERKLIIIGALTLVALKMGYNIFSFFTQCYSPELEKVFKIGIIVSCILLSTGFSGQKIKTYNNKGR
jgi:hypothetical protein